MEDSNPKPQETPQIDPAVIAKQAEALATQKVEELKNNLVSSLSGQAQSRYGDTGPKSWDDLHDTIKNETVEEAEKRILAKIEAKDKAREDEQKKTQASQEAKQQEEWARMSQEWSEAVADGIIPDINAQVKAKLKSGVKFDELTPEEQSDEGLKVYNELVATHVKLKGEGKSSSLYRTAQKFYNQPAGAHAPVLGSSTPTPANTEYSYDEITANRKAKLGW